MMAVSIAEVASSYSEGTSKDIFNILLELYFSLVEVKLNITLLEMRQVLTLCLVEACTNRPSKLEW